jgi:hypothetical protein
MLVTLVRKVFQRRPELHSGVVDQNVDRAALPLYPVHRHGYCLVIGHVEGGPRRVEAGRAQLGDDRRHPLRRAAVQHHRRAVLREPPRQGEADALAGAGDQRPPSGEVEKSGLHVHATRCRQTIARARLAGRRIALNRPARLSLVAQSR